MSPALSVCKNFSRLPVVPTAYLPLSQGVTPAPCPAWHRPERTCPPPRTCKRKRQQMRASLQAGKHAKNKILLPRASNAEALSPFCAARAQHSAAATCLHAHPKSMRTLAPSCGRLVSPFHDFCLSSFEKPAITTAKEHFCQSDSAPNSLYPRQDRRVDNFTQKR